MLLLEANKKSENKIKSQNKAVLSFKSASLKQCRQEKRACISRYPASQLKGERVHKTSRHSSRLGTQDHFHSLGNSFTSTPTS